MTDEQEVQKEAQKTQEDAQEKKQGGKFDDLLLDIIANSNDPGLRRVAEKYAHKKNPLACILNEYETRIGKNLKKVPKELRSKTFFELDALKTEIAGNNAKKQYKTQVEYAWLEQLIILAKQEANKCGEILDAVNTKEKFLAWLNEHKDAKALMQGAAIAPTYSADLVEKLLQMYPALKDSAPKIPEWITSLSSYLGPFRVKGNGGDVFSNLAMIVPNLPPEKFPDLEELLFEVVKYFYMPEFNKDPSRYTLVKLQTKTFDEKNPMMKSLQNRLLDYCKKVYKVVIPGAGSLQQSDEQESAKNLQPTEQSQDNGHAPKMQLYAFQVVGAAKHLAEKKRALLADEMSMFKTAQAIYSKMVIEEKEGKMPTFVVCPPSMPGQWVREILNWYQNPRIAMLEKDGISIRTKEGEQSFFKWDGKVRGDRNSKVDLVSELKNVDFAISHYPLLSKSPYSANASDNALARHKVLSECNFRHVILDEVQNAKNPEALRTRVVKELADSAEYLSLLSGTPVPNSIVDAYMIMSYVDPDTFKIDFEDKNATKAILNGFYALYRKDPWLVKKVWDKFVLRREANSYIKEKIPEIEGGDIKDIEVLLEGEHARVYNEIYSNDSLMLGKNLLELEKAALDPNLVDPKCIRNEELRKKIGSIDSLKYKKLDEIISEEIKQGRKVLVFTSHFAEGITRASKDKNGESRYDANKILGKRYEKYNCLVIDGDIPIDSIHGGDSEREQIRKNFFKPGNDVLVATIGTMNEGVDLTAADTVIFLDQPYTPSALWQAVKRVQRVGARKKDSMRAYSLIAKLPDKKTIDEGIKQMLKDKEQMLNRLVNGPPIDIGELKLIATDDRSAMMHSKAVQNVLMMSRKQIGSHLARYVGSGGDAFEKWVKKDAAGAERFAISYATHLNDSYSGNTARVYTKIIKGLEQIGRFEKKADLASGPAVLSYFLNEPTINVDVNPYALKIGRGIAAEGSEFREGRLHSLPIESQSCNMTLCSLAIHLLACEKKKKNEIFREREQALREINRVLKNDGYFIGTVPLHCIDENDAQRFYGALEKLGFVVVNELSGHIKGKEDKAFGVYIVTARKTGEPQKQPLEDGLLKWCKDKQLVSPPEYKVIEKKGLTKKDILPDDDKQCMHPVKIKCENFMISKHETEYSLDSVISSYVSSLAEKKNGK